MYKHNKMHNSNNSHVCSINYSNKYKESKKSFNYMQIIITIMMVIVIIMIITMMIIIVIIIIMMDILK